MLIKLKKACFFILFCLFSFATQAQIAIVKGKVQDASTQKAVAGVLIEVQGKSFQAKTDAQGNFLFEGIPYGPTTFQFTNESYDRFFRTVEINAEQVDLGIISMNLASGTNGLNSEDFVPVIMLSDDDLDKGSSGSQNISGVLNANRDVFTSKVAFAFSAARFRMRGYDSKNTELYFNGIPMNDLENGRPSWWAWSGLNDVTRGRSTVLGLNSSIDGFGGLMGTSAIDARPSNQRPQTRISYMSANRSYRHRVMATYSSGLMKGDWAISASASWRYANRGYTQGTYYNAASYFLAVEKLFGKHSLTLTALGTPSVRGRSGPATLEAYGVTHSNFYNPYWGYQTSGETGKRQIRNSRMSDSHQPLFILNHQWEGNKVTWKTAASYQFGKYGTTRLDWNGAADPRMDYYRKLPTYYSDNPEMHDYLEQLISDNPEILQLNWDEMYNTNRGANAYEVIADANGVVGDTVRGNRAKYILGESRFDSKKANFNTQFTANATDYLSLSGGLTYQYYNGITYQIVEDLLGADYHLDVDRFIARDNPGAADNNLDTPNKIVRQGEKYGYDYESFIHKGSAWAQANFTFNKIDFFVAGSGSTTAYWREGKIRTAIYQDADTLSEKKLFINYAAKGGLTYKINGRNYFYANGMYMTRAPYFRNAMYSVRNSNQFVGDLKSERIYSVEGGYELRAPQTKARVTGYYTKFMDKTNARGFYLDNALEGENGAFVNYVTTNQNIQHWGIEAAAEHTLNSGLQFSAAVAYGQNTYLNRPDVEIFLTNTNDLEARETVYIKNYNIAGSPQLATNIGVSYRSKKFWNISLNFNYFDNAFADIFPERRTMAAVTYSQDPTYQEQAIMPGSELWNSILDQEKLPSMFTADLFFSKSWKVKKKYILFMFGVNNLLNSTNLVSSGFEQYRFDFRDRNVNKFQPKYYYGNGMTYMAQLSISF